MDLICAMHENDRSGEVTGTVLGLARLARCAPEEMQVALDELADTETACVTLHHEKVTITNRRMQREAKERTNNKIRQSRKREKDKTAEVTQKSRLHTSSSSSTTENNKPSAYVEQGQNPPQLDLVPEEEKSPPKADQHGTPKQQAVFLLGFLNEKTGRNYQPVQANLKLILARLKEYDEPTVRKVIANRCMAWQGNDRMQEFLRPSTLFNATKFAQYAGLLGSASPQRQNHG